MRQGHLMSLYTWCCQSSHDSGSCATSQYLMGQSCQKLEKNPNITIPPEAIDSTPVYPSLPGSPRSKLPSHLLTRSPLGQSNQRLGKKNLKSATFPAVLAAGSPENLVRPGPLRFKQLPYLHTCSSLGQAQVLQSSLRSKLLWMICTQRWR